MFNYKDESLYRVASKDCQPHEREKIMTELSIADVIFTFYRTIEGENKVLFTEIGVNEFLLLCTTINRHTPIEKLLRLALKDVEKMREVPCIEHDFTYKAIEYIKMGKLYQPLKNKPNEQL
jgi:hypothetical protein